MLPPGPSKRQTSTHYDVLIVGASVAGCMTALRFARLGLQVAVIEKQADAKAYKLLCTHFLYPAALAHLRWAGVYDALLAAGAVPSQMQLHSPAGWSPVTLSPGLNVRRALLDPCLREAAQKAGVHLFYGHKVRALARHPQGRVTGVQTSHQDRRQLFEATLVVAADGRHSSVARLMGIAPEIFANDRFSYFAYHQTPAGHNATAPEAASATRVWMQDEGRAFVSRFPNDQGLQLLSCYLPQRHFSDWQGQVETRFYAEVHKVAELASLGPAQRVGRILGLRHAPSLWRPAVSHQVALVGDAAVAIDPLTGIGCTWAMQSAQQLTQSLGGALLRLKRQPCSQAQQQRRLQRALSRYRFWHWLKFRPALLIARRYSRDRPLTGLERLLLQLVARVFRSRLQGRNPGNSASPSAD